MWVKMEDLGDHRCSSGLVLTIQLLGYLILTQSHIVHRKGGLFVRMAQDLAEYGSGY